MNKYTIYLFIYFTDDISIRLLYECAGLNKFISFVY
jgi:hypothetical protein